MKLIEALTIIRAAPQQAAQQMNVYLATGFTPLHLQTFLAAHLQLLLPKRQITVHTGLYGDAAGNLERAADQMPDAIALALEWPDFDPRLGIRTVGHASPSENEIRHNVERQRHRLQEIIEQRLPDSTIAVCLPSIAPRLLGPQPGWLTAEVDAILLKCNADFAGWAAGKKNLRLLSQQRLDQVSPSNTRWDIGGEISSGFPYSLNHASILAEFLSRLIHSPQPKKGLITDLDDTLWSGIVGEIGVDKISWSMDAHSHVHALFQQQLSHLSHAGALVAVASKNDPSIVQKAFERPDLLLNANQVFPIEASWGPKSAAVRRILESWNIGAESVVFVDDSPMELAEVKNSFPEMECLPFPKHDPTACVGLLDRIRDLFGKLAISEEDTLRLNSLRVQPALTRDFLEDAEAEVTFTSLKDLSDSRPLELINKTNQFNLNGRRYTEAEWRRYLSDSNSRLLVVSYKDKYGHLGKIAVLGARADNREVFVDTWVMSCRAFSRRIEHLCLRRLFEGFSAKEISFDFEPTSRNAPIGEFFSGFLSSAPQGRFRLSRQSFEEMCPPLFHAVKDNHHE